MDYGQPSTHGRRISKNLYERDSRVSLLRTGELALGAGLLASGAGRSKMLGEALGRGVKLASARNNERVVEALQRAEAARGTIRVGMQPTERRIRQIQAVDRAVSAVPASMRPAVAMSAGALLVSNSHPIRRTSYRPAPGW
jgi:hypothetical protein